MIILIKKITIPMLFSVLLATSVVANSAESTSLPLTETSAAQVVQTETNAKILSVEQTTEEGKLIFHVKALHQDGKVKIYHLDAATGKNTK